MEDATVDSRGSSNRRTGRSRGGELSGRLHCGASRDKRRGTPLKELQSSSRASIETKPPSCSEEAGKTPPAPDASSFLALEHLARAVMPEASPPCKRHLGSSLGSKTLSRGCRTQKAKDEDALPRKRGRRHPGDLNGVPPPAPPKRRRGLSLEDVNLVPSPRGPASGPEDAGRGNTGRAATPPQRTEAKEDLKSSSDLSPRLHPVKESSLSPALGDEDEEDELPNFLLSQEPGSIEEGKLVWCKFQRYPYWPAVVRNVMRKAKRASIVFIEKGVEDKSRGLSVSLRNLKHFDCKEKQELIEAAARSNYQTKIQWCLNLIQDYRIRVGCNSFVGSFLEYCSDAMSYPTRTESLDLPPLNVPHVEERKAPSSPSKATPTRVAKKVLPDRTRAARDRANKRIVDFIVKAKGADAHLQAVLRRQKPSRWLGSFLHAPSYLTVVEAYLEDESQQDLVYNHLKGIYKEADAKTLPAINGDSSRFILEVLFPEAIIYAISAVDQIDLKKAEEKYIRGPLVGPRERELFEEEILEQKRKQDLQREQLSAEDAL